MDLDLKDFNYEDMENLKIDEPEEGECDDISVWRNGQNETGFPSKETTKDTCYMWKNPIDNSEER